MKNENGKAKAILITVISILIIALIAVLVIFKFKGNSNKNGGKNGSTGTGDYTDTMTLIEDNDKEYVFIDSNGNVRKLSKSKVGDMGMASEGTIYYQNSLCTKKDDKNYIIDFDGNVLYESEKDIKTIINSKDAILYQVNEDGEYGIVNAKGEKIVEAKYSDYFESISNDIDPYIYNRGYSSTSSGYEISFFDKDGKVVYTGPTEESSLFGNKSGKTRTGINLVEFRKTKTSIVVLNLNTGEEIATLTDNGDHTFDIETKGNVAIISSYKQGTYGANEGDTQTKYIWFDQEGKISNVINKNDKEYISFWNGSTEEDYTIYRKENNEEVAIDKYGKEVYKTTASLSQLNHTNKITGKTTSVIIDSKAGTINSEGKVIITKKAKAIGNKYIFDGSTLYNLDGSVYMENVKSYESGYNLDIIRTAEKTIIENQDGKSIEKEADFSVKGDWNLLNDNTIAVIEEDEKVTFIKMDDLSFKELDTNGSKYVFVKKGYISVSKSDSEYEYYNANGDKIYTRSKK